MKKTIISLLVLVSLSAFIFKVSNKSVPGVEINIKTSTGETVNNGRTDKNGAFLFKIPDKGNYVLSIESGEIIKALNEIKKGKKTDVSYLVTVAFEAETNNWTVDTEKYKTHKVKRNNQQILEFTRELVVGASSQINEWPIILDINSQGNGEIKGDITYRKK